MEEIRVEDAVFVHDGGTAIGAVREAPEKSGMFRIDVENAGEWEVPRSAVKDVLREQSGGKVVLDRAKLDPALRNAIAHAHDGEDLRAADRPLPGDR